MLTLFHAPKSRSTRMIWLLEELGAPCEIKVVDIVRPSGGARDPANPHPHGQVPALVDDGVLITESAAIALYLTDRFREQPMGPAVGDPLRGPYLTWLAYYAGVLEPVIAARWSGKAGEAENAAYEILDGQLKGALERGPWLLGDDFSAADIMFISLLQFARQMLPPHAVYGDWLARAQTRPALARALLKDDA
ncbi:MAG: glutathione S-transferase [Caulobacter sp.]|nr:glutathione S-transferase [Caulobacter sp.]